MTVFTAGIVLLLNIWGGKRSGLSTDPNKEMADVHKCMQVLRACETRYGAFVHYIWVAVVFNVSILGQMALYGAVMVMHPSIVCL